MSNEKNPHLGAQQFAAFPAEKVQAMEARAKMNPKQAQLPKRTVAQNITMVPPGTPAHEFPAASSAQGQSVQSERMPHRIPPGGLKQQQMHQEQIGAFSPQAQTSIDHSILQQHLPQAEPYITVNPSSEDEYLNYEMPSNFLFYDFKDIYIKPFKGRNFSKLARARDEESLLHTVEAVSSVIYTSQDPERKGLAFDLTLPDFYSCLYWLRMNSFLKHGLTHQTMCRSRRHHDWVNKGYRVMEDENGNPVLDEQGNQQIVQILPDTLKYQTTVTRGSLVVNKLNSIPEGFDLDADDIYLVPVTMRDIVELTTNETIDRYTARTASSFQFKSHKASLQERMARVDDLSADDIATITSWEKAASKYGPDESFQWTCKTCGFKHDEMLKLEAHSFFPSAA